MSHLPAFRYHPDPVATGAIAWSSTTCRCCGRSTGYIYVGPVYSIEELNGCLCPWCIADGSAATKFGASFVDKDMLQQEGLDERIIDELAHRTPCYGGRQQEQWLTHCNDACAFHGEATVDDVQNMPNAVREAMEDTDTNQVDWTMAKQRYKPRGPLGIYKFCCLHCGRQLAASDCL